MRQERRENDNPREGKTWTAKGKKCKIKAIWNALQVKWNGFPLFSIGQIDFNQNIDVQSSSKNI